MCFQLSAHVSAVRGLSPAERALLHELAHMADGVRQCFPSVAYLARLLEVSDRYVQGLLKGLEARGLLVREARPVNGRRSSDLFTVLPGAVIAARSPARSVQRSQSRPAARRAGVNHSSQAVVNHSSPKSIIRESKGAGARERCSAPPSPRLPHDRGGASSARSAVGVPCDPASLSAFVRDSLLCGQARLVGGVLVKPGAPEWAAFMSAVRGLDASKNSRTGSSRAA